MDDFRFPKQVDEFPTDIVIIAQQHLDVFTRTFEITRGVCQRLASSDPNADFPKAKFFGRIEPTISYANNGNTQVPGTRYSLVWIYNFSDDAPNEWVNWYTGSLVYAIAHSMEITVRNSDRRKDWQSWNLVSGRWDRKMNTIESSTNVAVPNITDNIIADLFTEINAMRERLRLMKSVMYAKNCRASERCPICGNVYDCDCR